MPIIASRCVFNWRVSSPNSLNACLERSRGLLLVSRSVCTDVNSSNDEFEGIEQNRRAEAGRHGRTAEAVVAKTKTAVSDSRQDPPPYAGWRRHPKPTHLTMVVDRAFDARHSALELRRVHLQTRLALELNRTLKCPVSMHLHLANYTAPENLPNALASAVHNGTASHSAKEPWDVYPRERLVYLSPDSDNVLQDLEQDRVYVMGGIVDLQIEPNITLDKARGLGVMHARLPMQEHFRMRNHTYLPMNHVCEILLRYACFDDWPRVIAEVVRHSSVAEPNGGWEKPREIMGKRHSGRRF